MKKQQVDHILRAAGEITGETQFIIIGSQSLHGKHRICPMRSSARSKWIDRQKKPDRTEWLNMIGQDSRFHETHGYYADPVDEKTATLPKGWKGRLVNLPPGDTAGVTGAMPGPARSGDRQICSAAREGYPVQSRARDSWHREARAAATSAGCYAPR